MKSRLAITALIAVGAMMSGTGATLAIGGSSSSDNASVAEYDIAQPPKKNAPSNPEQVLGDQENSPPAEPEGQEVAGVQEDSGAPADEAQPTQQVAAAGDGGDTLPFTGFLAIPLLIGGAALLATGGVLRLKSRDSA